jgi:predicted tellurium resistance membrane protein TerC
MSLKAPLFTLVGHAFSWRDLVLIVGGLFLIYKGTQEIHGAIEGGGDEHAHAPPRAAGFARVIASIMALDIVFSLDSVITAVGMSDDFAVMATAVIIAVLIMVFAAGPVANFVNAHPTVKMLALSFLLLIGMVLVADGFGVHVPKGFIYAAIGFSIFVEALNMLARKRGKAA